MSDGPGFKKKKKRRVKRSEIGLIAVNSAFFLCRSTAYWVTGQWYHTRGATQLPTLAPSRADIHLEEEAGIPLLRRRRRESGRGAAQGACVAVRQWGAAQGAGADPEQRARAGLHPR